MDIDEVTQVCKLIRSLCPAQKWEPETPAVWQRVLFGIRVHDALMAVEVLGTREDFISPKDILAEVRRIRAERLKHSDRILPNADPDDVADYLAALRAGITATASGRIEVPPEPIEHQPGMRRIDAATRGAFRRPVRPLPVDYGARPRPKAIEPPREVSAEETARAEAERARQLAATQKMIDEAADMTEAVA